MTRLEQFRQRCERATDFHSQAHVDLPWAVAKLDALASLLRDLPECTCHEAYTDRDRIDPSCHRCGCFPVEGEVERALDGLEES